MTGTTARFATTAVVAFTLLACGEDTPLAPVVTEDVLVVTQPESFQVFFASEYRGEVLLDPAGCFRLALDPPNDATVVWPPGTTLWARGDQLELQDARGRQIVAIGGQHRFLGGFVAGLGEVADLNDMELAETMMRCPGTYWLLRAGTSRRITG